MAWMADGANKSINPNGNSQFDPFPARQLSRDNVVALRPNIKEVRSNPAKRV
jgi:hypothetical protein